MTGTHAEKRFSFKDVYNAKTIYEYVDAVCKLRKLDGEEFENSRDAIEQALFEITLCLMRRGIQAEQFKLVAEKISGIGDYIDSILDKAHTESCKKNQKEEGDLN